MATISVVIVSDYQSSAVRSWNDERACFRALAAQDILESVEYMLCEDAQFEGTAPEDLSAILPGLQIRYFPVSDSYSLKNAGMRAVKSEFVAQLDADCQPSSNWLRAALATMRRDKAITGVSGLTTYAETALPVRLSALLSRGYLSPGKSGSTEFLSNNCAVVRREAFLLHPLPESLGAFSSRMQSNAMLLDGGRFWFDGDILIIHEFEGWRMETDIRRNLGWGTVTTRLADGSLPYSGLVRLGPLSIPAIWAGKLWNCWMDCLRCGRQYGLRWFEVPLALAAACVVISMEVPGMWVAYRREKLSATAYR